MSADLISTLQARFPRLTPRPSGDHPAVNAPLEDVVSLLRCLRDEHGFDLLSDLTAIDWSPGASPRFTVVYHLLSSSRAGAYVRVAAPCAGTEEAPVAPSVTSLWAGADWHERECFDLLGVRFEGHPDLRRILMWDGYPYHPLRKDFPLAGIETELPAEDVAAETGTRVVAAPMAGGPFVASPGEINLTEAEPRAKDESWSDCAPQPGHTPLRQVKE
ncbi:MAG: NADH-quinone oxidoreductase subunit C [Verrucomicrobia bacterium]|nr:NADH-quinone oxidoreductase subunit C [Verrucomicrobiota bacterium]